MRKFYFIFLISFSILAQNPKLEVKVNTINYQDISDYTIEYHINYQIENKTSNEVSFFLLPNALIANTASSLSLYPVYKMYQNGVFEDMDGPFFEYETENELNYAKIEDKKSTKAIELAERMKKINSFIFSQNIKKYRADGGKSTDLNWIFENQKLLHNIVILKPNETRNFTIKTLWNRNRFIKNDDLEFYLDENKTIEIQLILDLKTNLFKDQLSEEDLVKINSNPNFIKGEFASNKMQIHFKE